MPINISIRVDTSGLRGLTNGQIAKQASFAMANTLNDLAFEARRDVQEKLPRWLNLTRPFIPRSLVVEKANKRQLTAILGFLDRVHLIHLMEKGGTRVPHQSKVLAIPSQARRNKKGGITKSNRPSALVQKPNVFVGRVRGVDGIWQRTGGRKRAGIKLLYAFEPAAEYPGGQIHFEEEVRRLVRAGLEKTWARQWARALATMKR